MVFGRDAVQDIGRHLEEFGAVCPAVLCTPTRVSEGEKIASLFGAKAHVVARAVMHTPVEISDAAAAEVTARGSDLLIAIGGGSAIGLGKALVKRTGLKLVAIPTTYSGSEITPTMGQRSNGEKNTERDDRFRPSAIIYDPALTLALPTSASTASGMNALTHAVWTLCASEDEDLRWAAKRAAELFVRALPQIKAEPASYAARAEALYASWLTGYCVSEAKMPLHYRICHALGGAFDTPHAETHAVLLPHTLAFTGPACARAVEELTTIFGGDPAAEIQALVGQLGLPASLAEVGLPEDGIDHIADLVCTVPYPNPRAFDRADVAALLRRAWSGEQARLDDQYA
ncbi:MAG: maleylacetate reductase [Sphingomonadaceae bacterium]|nr:maleylacetate reductase [Sphingomonadaceae bacterium]